MILFSLISLNGYTHNVYHRYVDNSQVTVNYNVCAVPGDTIWLHKPSSIVTSFHWSLPGGASIYNKDSVAVTITNQGQWKLYWGTNNKTINIAFVTSAPVKPWPQTTSNACGIWDAQPTPQTGTTYLWSMGGDTTQVKTITTPGTYPVMITNACGSVSDTIQILWSEPTPSLLTGGPFCLGIDTLQLDPSYTHQYNGYIWAGGATTRTISASHSGTYSVTVTNAGGCKMSSSTTLQFDTAVSIEMCDVGFDTVSGKNKISWFVNPTQTQIDSVRVEVKDQLGNWVTIGSPPYTDGEIIHWGSNPQQDYNEYRIIAIGRCGYGTPSQIHRSIWLSTFPTELQWQNYYGTFIPSYYVVFALMDNGANIPIDTVPSCSGAGCLNHSAIIANPHILKYFVAFQHTCSSNKSTGDWVRSNYWDLLSSVTETTTQKQSILISPNPTTGEVYITGPVGNYQIDVYNINGGKIIETKNIGNIDLGKFAKGLYFIKVTTGSKIYTEKVVKL